MQDPLLLYSTNTWLAYQVSQRYYRGEHYVWCAPVFDPRGLGDIENVIPPSSSPFEIYRSLSEEVRRGDRHSSKIVDNHAGILRGADYKLIQNNIRKDEFKEIKDIADSADIRDFRPLLYIIPFDRVSSWVKQVPVNQRGHPLSIEFIIEVLPRACFDIITLEWR